MTALSALAACARNAVRWRVGLLTLVVILVAGNIAAGGIATGGSPTAGQGYSDSDPPMAGDHANARAYLDSHNALRAAVQPPAGYLGAWLPIPPLAWSDEVAGGAQAWAEHLRDTKKCALMHSDTRDGENLAAGKGMNAASAVKMWASEVKRFTYSPQYEFDIPTGHYSQVVWRKTTHIGCGRAHCGRNSVVVCRYSPAGNRIGKAPY